MRRRSRSRDSGHPLGSAAVVVVAILAVAAGGGVEAGAFSTASLDRTSSIDVTSDPDGTLGVDAAPSVHTNATEPLANFTNRLGRTATVTVELRATSTDRGDLVVNGRNEDDRVSVTLDRGESARIDVSVPDDGSLVGEAIRFDVRGSAAGFQVSINDRSVPIEG